MPDPPALWTLEPLGLAVSEPDSLTVEPSQPQNRLEVLNASLGRCLKRLRERRVGESQLPPPTQSQPEFASGYTKPGSITAEGVQRCRLAPRTAPFSH